MARLRFRVNAAFATFRANAPTVKGERRRGAADQAEQNSLAPIRESVQHCDVAQIVAFRSNVGFEKNIDKDTLNLACQQRRAEQHWSDS